MLEKAIEKVLQRIYGNIIENIDDKAMKVGFWKGDVELYNLKFRENTLLYYKIPARILKSNLEYFKIKISMKSNEKPTTVTISDVSIVAQIIEQSDWENIYRSLEKTSQEMFEEILEYFVEAKKRLKHNKKERSPGFFKKLFSKAFDNVEVLFTNIQITLLRPDSSFGYQFKISEFHILSNDKKTSSGKERGVERKKSWFFNKKDKDERVVLTNTKAFNATSLTIETVEGISFNEFDNIDIKEKKLVLEFNFKGTVSSVLKSDEEFPVSSFEMEASNLTFGLNQKELVRLLTYFDEYTMFSKLVTKIKYDKVIKIEEFEAQTDSCVKGSIELLEGIFKKFLENENYFDDNEESQGDIISSYPTGCLKHAARNVLIDHYASEFIADKSWKKYINNDPKKKIKAKNPTDEDIASLRMVLKHKLFELERDMLEHTFEYYTVASTLKSINFTLETPNCSYIFKFEDFKSKFSNANYPHINVELGVKELMISKEDADIIFLMKDFGFQRKSFCKDNFEPCYHYNIGILDLSILAQPEDYYGIGKVLQIPDKFESLTFSSGSRIKNSQNQEIKNKEKISFESKENPFHLGIENIIISIPLQTHINYYKFRKLLVVSDTKSVNTLIRFNLKEVNLIQNKQMLNFSHYDTLDPIKMMKGFTESYFEIKYINKDKRTFYDFDLHYLNIEIPRFILPQYAAYSEKLIQNHLEFMKFEKEMQINRKILSSQVIRNNIFGDQIEYTMILDGDYLYLYRDGTDVLAKKRLYVGELDISEENENEIKLEGSFGQDTFIFTSSSIKEDWLEHLRKFPNYLNNDEFLKTKSDFNFLFNLKGLEMKLYDLENAFDINSYDFFLKYNILGSQVEFEVSLFKMFAAINERIVLNHEVKEKLFSGKYNSKTTFFDGFFSPFVFQISEPHIDMILEILRLVRSFQIQKQEKNFKNRLTPPDTSSKKKGRLRVVAKKIKEQDLLVNYRLNFMRVDMKIDDKNLKNIFGISFNELSFEKFRVEKGFESMICWNNFALGGIGFVSDQIGQKINEEMTLLRSKGKVPSSLKLLTPDQSQLKSFSISIYKFEFNLINEGTIQLWVKLLQLKNKYFPISNKAQDDYEIEYTIKKIKFFPFANINFLLETASVTGTYLKKAIVVSEDDYSITSEFSFKSCENQFLFLNFDKFYKEHDLHLSKGLSSVFSFEMLAKSKRTSDEGRDDRLYINISPTIVLKVSEKLLFQFLDETKSGYVKYLELIEKNKSVFEADDELEDIVEKVPGKVQLYVAVAISNFIFIYLVDEKPFLRLELVNMEFYKYLDDFAFLSSHSFLFGISQNQEFFLFGNELVTGKKFLKAENYYALERKQKAVYVANDDIHKMKNFGRKVIEDLKNVKPRDSGLFLKIGKDIKTNRWIPTLGFRQIKIVFFKIILESIVDKFQEISTKIFPPDSMTPVELKPKIRFKSIQFDLIESSLYFPFDENKSNLEIQLDGNFFYVFLKDDPIIPSNKEEALEEVKKLEKIIDLQKESIVKKQQSIQELKKEKIVNEKKISELQEQEEELINGLSSTNNDELERYGITISSLQAFILSCSVFDKGEIWNNRRNISTKTAFFANLKKYSTTKSGEFNFKYAIESSFDCLSFYVNISEIKAAQREQKNPSSENSQIKTKIEELVKNLKNSFFEISSVFKKISIYIIDDTCPGWMPMFNIQVENFQAIFKLSPESIASSIYIELYTSYYNHRIAFWEPVIEGFGMDLEIVTTEGEITSFNAKRNEASQMLNLDISSTFIQLLKKFKDILNDNCGCDDSEDFPEIESNSLNQIRRNSTLTIVDENDLYRREKFRTKDTHPFSSSKYRNIWNYVLKNETGYKIAIQQKSTKSSEYSTLPKKKTQELQNNQSVNIFFQDSEIYDSQPDSLKRMLRQRIRIEICSTHEFNKINAINLEFSKEYILDVQDSISSHIHQLAVRKISSDFSNIIVISSRFLIENNSHVQLSASIGEEEKFLIKSKESWSVPFDRLDSKIILGIEGESISSFTFCPLDLLNGNEKFGKRLIIGRTVFRVELEKKKIMNLKIFPLVCLHNHIPLNIFLKISEKNSSLSNEVSIESNSEVGFTGVINDPNSIGLRLRIPGYSWSQELWVDNIDCSQYFELYNASGNIMKIKALLEKKNEKVIRVHVLSETILINQTPYSLTVFSSPEIQICATEPIIESDIVRKNLIALGNIQSFFIGLEGFKEISDEIGVQGKNTASLVKGYKEEYVFFVEVKNEILEYETENGPQLSFIKHIILLPQLTIHNISPFSIRFSQVQTKDFIELSPNFQLPFHWRELTVIAKAENGKEYKLKGEINPFSLGEQQFALRSVQDPKEIINFETKVRHRGLGSFYFTINESNKKLYFQNDTNFIMKFIQEGGNWENGVTTIEPGKITQISLENPTFSKGISIKVLKLNKESKPYLILVDKFQVQTKIDFTFEQNMNLELNFENRLNGNERIITLSSSSNPNDQIEEGRTIDLVLNMGAVGISLISNSNWDSKEILYFYSDSISILHSYSNVTTKTILVCENMEVENKSEVNPKYNSILSSKDGSEYFIKLLCERDRRLDEAFYFKKIDLEINEFYLRLDQVFIDQMKAFLNSAYSNQSESQLFKLFNHNDFIQLILKQLNDDNGVHKLIYIENLYLSEIQMNLTLCNLSTTEGTILPNSLFNIETAPISLPSFKMNSVFESVDILGNKISSLYILNLKKQFLKILGSTDLLGNPNGLIRNLTEGVGDFFVEPYQGFKKGPIQGGKAIINGSGSLMGKTMTGVLNSLEKLSGSVGSGVAALSMDADFIHEREIIRVSNPRSTGDGFRYAGRNLFNGFSYGVTGLYRMPAEGDGCSGFSKGFALGVAGLAIKPVCGIFDAASKSFSSLKMISDRRDSSNILRTRRPFYGYQKYYKVYSGDDALFLEILQSFYLGDEDKFSFYGSILYFNTKKSLHTLLFTDLHILDVNYENRNLEWDIRLSEIIEIKKKPMKISILIKDKKSIKKRKIIFANSSTFTNVYDKIEEILEIQNNEI